MFACAPYPYDAFSHGYLVSVDRHLPAAVRQWRQLQCGRATVALHPKATAARVGLSGGSQDAVIIIGHPVDADSGASDLNEITRNAAEILAAGGIEGFTRYVAYLTGRFTTFAIVDNSLWVLPDTCATQSIYWSGIGGRVTVGSHVELVAVTVGADVNDDALRRLRQLKNLRPGMTHFFAGIETAYRGVHPVIANCRLACDLRSGRVTHQRFYPFEEIAPVADADTVYQAFRETFRRVCWLLSSFGRTGVSLTAGDDSRTTLLGALPYLGPDSFTFTYFNAANRTDAHLADVIEANRLSTSLGLPHRILRWRQPAPGSVFDQVFSTTWRAHRPSAGAACAMYEDLPHGFFQLQSMHAEVGTVFYRRRTADPPTARRLARLYQSPNVAELPEYVERFEEFIDYAQFSPDRHCGFDYHDMFYWECRVSRWAAQKPHEGDLGHRVLQPFNCRRLIETMHRLPYPLRAEKLLLRRLISDGLAAQAEPCLPAPRRSAAVPA